MAARPRQRFLFREIGSRWLQTALSGGIESFRLKMLEGERDDMAIRYGTPGKDTIVGTVSNDLLYGFGE